MATRNAMSSIAARQRRELYMQEYQADRAFEVRQKIGVDWEKKSGARIEDRSLFRHLDRIQAQHNDALVGRRTRLADLLLREKEEYDAMLNNLTETDEQRRERLIRKAQQLRDRRVEDKRQDMERKNDKLFREKIDSLRQAESRLKTMQVSDARFSQLEAAKERRELEKEEEEFFAQQALETQRLANERAQNDLELRYERTERLKADLAAQVEGNDMRRALAKEEQKKDDDEFYRLLHEERCREAQKQMDRKERSKQIAEEMKELNEKLQRVRKEEYDRLRLEDKEELDRVLEALAAEEKQRREEKHARMLKERAYMQSVQDQIARKKKDDGTLDELWKEANDREWAKREAQWEADRTKRNQLLRNILIARRQQVLDKRQQEKDDAETRRREHELFLAELAKDGELEEKERARRAQQVKDTQRYYDLQISERRAAKEEEIRERRSALSEQQQLEEKYRQRIEQEFANLEAAKPARYRDVPLLPPRVKPF